MSDELDCVVFEETTHQYRDAGGTVRPSATQCLSAAGIYDFSAVKSEVLERKRIIGDNVHLCTAELDREGEVPEDWILPGAAGYMRAYRRFLSEWQPRMMSIEQPMIRQVGKAIIAGTPDRFLWLPTSTRLFCADLKTCAVKHPGWRLQTAIYEMMQTGDVCCGRLGRMSIQLCGDGRYSVTLYSDPSDAPAAHAAIAMATEEKTSRAYARAAESIRVWKRNNKVRGNETA
jgi:hypothetical protein